jgi:truncated hemoglobin YjbI
VSAPEPWPPTLYQWAGGADAIERLFERFYEKVVADDLVGPLFARMSEDHPQHVAAWIGEVFGGPAEYTDRLGGYENMMCHHLGKAITEQQRRRWVDLLADRRRRGPARRPRVPLGVHGLHQVGHAHRGRELPAGRHPCPARSGSPLGLGRGAALARLTGAGGRSVGAIRIRQERPADVADP